MKTIALRRRLIFKKISTDHKNALHAKLDGGFRTAYQLDEVLARICKYLNISREGLLQSKKGHLRNISIYLVKKQTGLTNRQIGELFGHITYTLFHETFDSTRKGMKVYEWIGLCFEETHDIVGFH